MASKSLLAALATLAGPWLIFGVGFLLLTAIRVKDYSMWTLVPPVLAPLGLAAGFWLAGDPGRGVKIALIGLGLGFVGGLIGFFFGASVPSEDAGAIAMLLVGFAVLVVVGPYALWAAWEAWKLAALKP